MIEVVAYLFFSGLVILWLLCILHSSLRMRIQKDSSVEERLRLLKQVQEDPVAEEEADAVAVTESE